MTATATLRSELGNLLAAIERATGKAARQSPSGFECHCPAHDDRHESLCVAEGADGKILVHCQAGCPTESILEAVGLGWDALFADGGATHSGNGREITAVYPYTDVDGNLLFEVCRTAEKGFLQRRPSGDGGHVWNRNGVEPVLYRLPAVLAAVASGKTVYVVEGERDAGSLEAVGAVATCNPGGAGKWRDSYNETLRGAHVCILPDNDAPGRKHANDVAKALHGTAVDVRVLDLPDLPPKGDVSDFLSNGGTREKLEALADTAPVFDLTAKAASTPKAGPKRTAPPLTDSGNAERLAARYGDKVLYCPAWRRFEVFTGQRWTDDMLREVGRRAKTVVREIPSEAKGVKDSDKVKAILRWAATSESNAKIVAMLSRAEDGLAVAPERFDPPATDYLLNVENGTVDLRTGELHPHDPAQMITRLAPVVFDPAAECPQWETFLSRIMDGNAALIGFLQRAGGLSLIGEVLERLLLILYGTGGNGKSIFRETIMGVLGDYALAAPVSTFMERRGDGPSNDLARLRGVRFVAASESEQGQRLSPAVVKAVTGGDTISARALYAEFFDFQPCFTPWLATNHRPSIPDGGDKALWDRIRLIPFTVEIPEEERVPTATLLATLRAEGPGILRWLVDGCREYLAEGLRPPNEVLAATKAYRDAEDVLADFIAERCIAEPLREVGKTELYRAYKARAEDQGEKPMTANAFSRRMTNRGVDSARQGNRRFWVGMGLQQ